MCVSWRPLPYPTRTRSCCRRARSPPSEPGRADRCCAPARAAPPALRSPLFVSTAFPASSLGRSISVIVEKSHTPACPVSRPRCEVASVHTSPAGARPGQPAPPTDGVSCAIGGSCQTSSGQPPVVDIYSMNSWRAPSSHLIDVVPLENRRASSLRKSLSEISATIHHKLSSRHCLLRSVRFRRSSSRSIVQPVDPGDSRLWSSATPGRSLKPSRSSMAPSCRAGRSRSTKREIVRRPRPEVLVLTCPRQAGRRDPRAAGEESAGEKGASNATALYRAVAPSCVCHRGTVHGRLCTPQRSGHPPP